MRLPASFRLLPEDAYSDAAGRFETLWHIREQVAPTLSELAEAMGVEGRAEVRGLARRLAHLVSLGVVREEVEATTTEPGHGGTPSQGPGDTWRIWACVGAGQRLAMQAVAIRTFLDRSTVAGAVKAQRRRRSPALRLRYTLTPMGTRIVAEAGAGG